MADDQKPSDFTERTDPGSNDFFTGYRVGTPKTDARYSFQNVQKAVLSPGTAATSLTGFTIAGMQSGDPKNVPFATFQKDTLSPSTAATTSSGFSFAGMQGGDPKSLSFGQLATDVLAASYTELVIKITSFGDDFTPPSVTVVRNTTGTTFTFERLETGVFYSQAATSNFFQNKTVVISENIFKFNSSTFEVEPIIVRCFMPNNNAWEFKAFLSGAAVDINNGTVSVKIYS